MSTPEALVLVIGAALLLGVMAWRVTSGRQTTRPGQPLDQSPTQPFRSSKTKRITVNRKFVLNGVTYTDAARIADPNLRKLVEDATRASGAGERKFVLNGVTYDDPAQIPDEHLRQLAEDMANLGPESVK